MDPVRAIALAAGLLLGACGATLADGSRSPQASAVSPLPSESPAAVASAAPTGQLPGSVVRVTVNGVPYPQGTELKLTPVGGAVVIELAFPFAVDKPSVERWLGTPAPITWTDDRTARLTFPETESNIGFKIFETRAADGSAVISLFVVNVVFPATRVINEFTIAELTAGDRGPAAATALRISTPGRLTVSPDGRRAITFQGTQMGSGPGPAMVELAARNATSLAQPSESDGPFAFADWLADGRLLIVGRDIWIGNGDGTAMRNVADAGAAAGNLPWTAVPSPSGERVALWGYTADGHIAIVDLRDGTVTRVAGPFRRFGQDTRVSLAWSRDGALLAGTDSDSEAEPTNARVRIVEVATNRTVRTIEGRAYEVSSFPSGELLVVRDSAERGEAARALGLVFGFDGLERRRYLGGGWSMSPNGRYLLQREVSAAGSRGYTLIDLSTRRSSEFHVASGFGRWLADGRLAFYY
jgi:hypothetical protein